MRTDNNPSSVEWVCVGWPVEGGKPVMKGLRLRNGRAMPRSEALKVFRIQWPNLRNHQVMPRGDG